MADREQSAAEVVAVCISRGGIPKTAVPEAEVTAEGLVGDGHEHEKHNRPHRAVLIQDLELLEELARQGFPVGPGILGENLLCLLHPLAGPEVPLVKTAIAFHTAYHINSVRSFLKGP